MKRQFERLASNALILTVVFNLSGVALADGEHKDATPATPAASVSRPSAASDITSDYAKTKDAVNALTDVEKIFLSGEKKTEKLSDAAKSAFSAFLDKATPVRRKLETCVKSDKGAESLTKLFDNFLLVDNFMVSPSFDQFKFAAFINGLEKYFKETHDIDDSSVKDFLSSAKELFNKIFTQKPEDQMETAKVWESIQQAYNAKISSGPFKTESSSAKTFLDGVDAALKDGAKACLTKKDEPKKNDDKKNDSTSDDKDSGKKKKSDDKNNKDEGQNWENQPPSGNGKPEEKPVEPPKPPVVQPPGPGETLPPIPHKDEKKKPNDELKDLKDLLKKLLELAKQPQEEPKKPEVPNLTPPKKDDKGDSGQATPPPQASQDHQQPEPQKQDRGDKNPPQTQQDQPRQTPPMQMPQSGSAGPQILSGDNNAMPSATMPANPTVAENGWSSDFTGWLNRTWNEMRSLGTNMYQGAANSANNVWSSLLGGGGARARRTNGVGRSNAVPVGVAGTIGSQVKSKLDSPVSRSGALPASIKKN